jgi:hypothetical protein
LSSVRDASAAVVDRCLRRATPSATTFIAVHCRQCQLPRCTLPSAAIAFAMMHTAVGNM